MNTFILVLSLVANYGWDLQKYDVKNAFIYREFGEEIHKQVPSRYDKKYLTIQLAG